MKKILWAVLAIAVLAAAIFLFILRHPEEGGHRAGPAAWYGDWLPPGTLATVNLTDLNSLASSFPATPLGRFLSRESMDSILAGLRVDPGKIARYNHFLDTVARVVTNPAFRAVFGDDAAVALLSPDPRQLRRFPEEELRRSLVVFATSSSSRTMERLARLILGGKVSREVIDTVDMTRISLDDGTTVYAYIRDSALLMAMDPHSIITCLRTRDGQGRTLQQNASFAAARSFWKQARGRLLLDSYVSLPGLRRLLRGTNGEGKGTMVRALAGMTYLAASVRRGTGELWLVSRAGFHRQELDRQVLAGFAAATTNTTLGLITPQILGYTWSSLFDQLMLDRALAWSAGGGRGRQEADARLRRQFGIPLARVQAAFGPQYGFILERIVNGGLFPVPQGVLFVQVRDHAAAAEVVAALRRDLARRGMTGDEKRTAQGETIYSWPLLPGEATRPALVLTGHMLYLANGRPLLQKILARRPDAPLPAEAARVMGSDMSRRFSDANYGAGMIRPARLAGQIAPAADWLARVVASANQVSLQPLNRELLTLLRSLEIVTGASRVEENSVSSEIMFRNASEEEGR